MKITSNATTFPSTKAAFYNKKRSPSAASSSSSSSTCSSASSSGGSSKRRDSPLRDSIKRTMPELMSAQMQRQQAIPRSLAEQEMQSLLELEYRDDVRSYMHEMQAKTIPSVELIEQQPELQWYMRPYLVDFLIEIHLQHRLRPETLYLAVNIVDRYVSKRIVFKKHYQLVGCAALWIAAKFEDAKDRVPTVPELCQMCVGAYDESAFIQMEGHVLTTINWVIGHPTAEAWLRLACVTGPLESQRTQHVARYLMEITLFHKDYIPFNPSDIALGSLLLARYMLGQSRRVFDESERVLQIASMLDECLSVHINTVSAIVYKKYSHQFYSRASIFVSEWSLSGRRFNYYEWTHPAATPLRKHVAGSSGRMSSSPAAPSSEILVSSSPARSMCDTVSSRSGASSDDSCFESDCEPLTPLTPLPPYEHHSSATEPTILFAQQQSWASQSMHRQSHEPIGKENLPRPAKSQQPRSHVAYPAVVRPPLARSSREMNAAPVLPPAVHRHSPCHQSVA
ncbi:hypothetical protein MVLG_04281 [Microbotryum lychnidis-dioicae p1A1 Lamole]|uniref:Uncharacterized protein n=1 Tax=Microbotryum lychnidis-dioicae (strain p1A1 Lamole / MvSl-1064) TaxID=683840 RepID=U5HAR3_USTV1|nr:hypothetical protein MVLG_04281 [Microbotryum lychnidis-dioicae p1A1 Lamole]|eukprot:KDE05370.1 hypothetical protein MVLG_04281 [Microbotryum lychnidis-dioicae p1A1 Lamole]